MINAVSFGTLRQVRADQLSSTPALAQMRYGLASATAAVTAATLTVPTLHHLDLPIPMAGLGTLFAMVCPLFLRDSTERHRGGLAIERDSDHTRRWWGTLLLLYATACIAWLAGALLSDTVITAGLGFLAIFFFGLLFQVWGPRATGMALNALVAYYLGVYLRPSAAHTGLALALSLVGLAVVIITCRWVWPIRASHATPPAPEHAPNASPSLPTCPDAAIGTTQASAAPAPFRAAKIATAQWWAQQPPLCWSPALRGMAAALLSIAVGHNLSPERWCWAVISVFVIFMGTRTRTDALRRGLQRLGGTVAGVLVSALLIMLIGRSLMFDCLLMAICVAGWAYHILHAYARGVFFITILIALVYAALGFALTPLLEIRLLEVIAGCVCAFATALIPVPAVLLRIHAGAKRKAGSDTTNDPNAPVDLAAAVTQAAEDDTGLEPLPETSSSPVRS